MPPKPSAERARLLSAQATALALLPRLEDAVGPIEEAVQVAAQVGAHGDHLQALITKGVGHPWRQPVVGRVHRDR